jgi:hypothetical protein
MRFVAPTARRFSALHVLERGAVLGDDGWAQTLCGLFTLPAECWAEVDRQHGDYLCMDCAAEAGLIHTLRPL